MISLRVLLVASLLALSASAMPHAAKPLDVSGFAAADAAGGPVPGAVIPNFRLTDHRGVTRELSFSAAQRASPSERPVPPYLNY